MLFFYVNEVTKVHFIVTCAACLIFFFLSIIWSLTSLPGLDGAFLFSMLLAMKAHAKLYITRRNALVLAAPMGKVVSDAGPSYRN